MHNSTVSYSFDCGGSAAAAAAVLLLLLAAAACCFAFLILGTQAQHISAFIGSFPSESVTTTGTIKSPLSVVVIASSCSSDSVATAFKSPVTVSVHVLQRASTDKVSETTHTAVQAFEHTLEDFKSAL
jgi:hypothetical protein